MQIKRKHVRDSKIKVTSKKTKFCLIDFKNSYIKLFSAWVVTVLMNVLLGLKCDFCWPLAICGKNIFDRYYLFGIKTTIIYFIMLLISSIMVAYTISYHNLGIISNICSWLHLVIFYVGNGMTFNSAALIALFSYVEAFLYFSEFNARTSLKYTKFLAFINIGYLFLIFCESAMTRCNSFLKSRTQRSVRLQNASYYCILETALPEDLWCYIHKTFRRSSKCLQAISNFNESISNEFKNSSGCNVPIFQTKSSTPADKTERNDLDLSSSSSSSRNASRQSSPDGEQKSSIQRESKMKIISYPSGNSSSQNLNVTKESSSNHQSSNETIQESSATNGSSNSASAGDNNEGGSGDGGEKKNPRSHGNKHLKDETTLKLESESRKLRSQLQALRSVEADLRSQMTSKVAAERASRAELDQVKNEFETLTSKLQSINERVESDRLNLEKAEKKLTEERKIRLDLEQELNELKKSSVAFLGTNSPLLQDQAIQNGTSEDSSLLYETSKKLSNTCQSRIKKLETDIKSLTRELSLKDQQIAALKSGSDILNSVSSSTNKNSSVNGILTSSTNGNLAAVSSLAVGAAITPGMSEQLQIKRNEFQQQELSNLKQEINRLHLLFNDEEDNKIKITQAYYESLKKVTDLQATLADKESEITHLNEQLDSLTPLYYNFLNTFKSQDNQAGPRPPSTNADSSHLIKGRIPMLADQMLDNMYSLRSPGLPNGHSNSTGHLQHNINSHMQISNPSHYGQYSDNDTELRYRSFGTFQHQCFQNMRPTSPSSTSSWFFDNKNQSSSTPEKSTNVFSRTPGRIPQSASNFVGHNNNVFGTSNTPDFGIDSTNSFFEHSTQNEYQCRAPSPRDFIVPVNSSTGRSRIVDNYFAKLQQSADRKTASESNQKSSTRSGGLLFTLDDSHSGNGLDDLGTTGSNSSNDGTPPPVEQTELMEEHRTMKLLEVMLEESRHRIELNHDLHSYTKLQSEVPFDDLNTLD